MTKLRVSESLERRPKFNRSLESAIDALLRLAGAIRIRLLRGTADYESEAARFGRVLIHISKATC